MSPFEIKIDEEKKKLVKELIKKLHQGENIQEVRKQFKEVLRDMNALEITQVEQELIKEGMDPREIFSMCDIHLEVFKENLSTNLDLAPPGHPIHTLMHEHVKLVEFGEKLFQTTKDLRKVKDFPFAGNILGAIQDIVNHFKEAEKHYLREENILFPYLEKHGITQPPKIMWMDHDRIRELKKEIFELVEGRKITDYSEFVDRLEKASLALAEYQSGHFEKENKILFPTAMKVISEEEWKDITKEFNDIGYCCFSPKEAVEAVEEEQTQKATLDSGIIEFETGKIDVKTLEAVLDTLPFDITFVDKNDRVAYYSNSSERLFVRTKAIIGRTVQNCHPNKSIHIVNKIINDFREGKKDKAEFWFRLGDKYVYIRYYAVRSREGEYLGTLEVSQDIAQIKQIEGDKKLLDWED
ncbi:MAG: DUF438 domain-containing protein [Candidatus Heimdallarchaeum aukensis]|uniref:DUF438 domain-containing protein n=1 Tax=Candidatus Heimdallarchaeum aukensis TaxID=2876573 RepID=A0A9Y1BN70_9ARCH|nr:MAG: DUF438 domain-containing protein [Candidatus Heimdallarchaeum aukensis]